MTDQDCACVATEHLECYNFIDVPDCEQLYLQLPHTIKSSYYLVILCFITSIALLFTIGLSMRALNSNISTEGYTVVAPLEVFDAEDEGL